tara:strand:- start:19643 stop:21100 length:1458 start_codon:yes stop_codon:yes gene_type:complete
MGILSDIVSNIETREGLPSVGGNFMDNFRNTSRFTTEDLVNPGRIDPPGFMLDQVNLDAMQRDTYGNFLANRVPEPQPVDPTTDPLTESLTGKETMYGVPGAASAAVNMGGSLSGGGLGGFETYAADPIGTYGVGTLDTYSPRGEPNLYEGTPEEYAGVFQTKAGNVFSVPEGGTMGSMASNIVNQEGGIGTFAKQLGAAGVLDQAGVEAVAGMDMTLPENQKALQDYIERSGIDQVEKALMERDVGNPARSRISGRDEEGRSTSSGTMGFTPGTTGPGVSFGDRNNDGIPDFKQQGPNVTSGKYASSKGPKGSPNYLKALGDSHAAFNAQMEASRANDLASAMQTLYGAAGSSFESGRNEYTESGQYDIDKARRDAEFDAMRAGNRPLTREETARRLAELQASIGFGGVMAPANAPMSTRVEPNPVPTNFELVSGFNVPAPVTGLPSLSAVNETTMSPVERNRRARLGRGRMMMNYGGLATFGL